VISEWTTHCQPTEHTRKIFDDVSSFSDRETRFLQATIVLNIIGKNYNFKFFRLAEMNIVYCCFT